MKPSGLSAMLGYLLVEMITDQLLGLFEMGEQLAILA